MKPSKILVVAVLVFSYTAARADFSYEETTQITGGSIVGMMKFAGTFSRQARQANEPVVSTVTIKGNRMMRSDKYRTEIVDLDAETVTDIDHAKKQYSVMTFAQMRQQIEAAMAKAKAQQAKQASQPAAASPQTVDLKFNVKVRNTGASKEVAGLEAKESILTMTMDAVDQTSGQAGAFAITNDMYLASEIPGYEEVREFYSRYAVKMGSVMSSAMNTQMLAMLQQPAAGKGMAEMVAEMSKLKGVPVLQIMRMGTTASGTPLPAASEAALPSGPPPPTAGDVAKAAVMSSLPFGGFGKRKKQDDAPPVSAAGQATAGVLVESNTQLTSFSRAAVDVSQFNPPAGYRQVDFKQID